MFLVATINAVLALIVGFCPFTHIGCGYGNFGKAHEDRKLRALRGYLICPQTSQRCLRHPANYRIILGYTPLLSTLWSAVEATQARLAGC